MLQQPEKEKNREREIFLAIDHHIKRIGHVFEVKEPVSVLKGLRRLF